MAMAQFPTPTTAPGKVCSCHHLTRSSVNILHFTAEKTEASRGTSQMLLLRSPQRPSPPLKMPSPPLKMPSLSALTHLSLQTQYTTPQQATARRTSSLTCFHGRFVFCLPQEASPDTLHVGPGTPHSAATTAGRRLPCPPDCPPLGDRTWLLSLSASPCAQAHVQTHCSRMNTFQGAEAKPAALDTTSAPATRGPH